jgi:hypothetical protein
MPFGWAFFFWGGFIKWAHGPSHFDTLWNVSLCVNCYFWLLKLTSKCIIFKFLLYEVFACEHLQLSQWYVLTAVVIRNTRASRPLESLPYLWHAWERCEILNKILVRKSYGRKTLGIHGRITLMWILRKCGVMMWTGCIWLRIEF